MVKRTSPNATSVLALCFVACLAGCADGDTESQQGALGTGGAPTWHADVAPIVTANCSGCHREGGIAPFSLDSYGSAQPWASLMVEAVQDGRMPPFLAEDTESCVPRFTWKDDLRLSADEVTTLEDWLAAGSPEGDPGSAAALTPPKPSVLEDYDVRVTVPKPVTVGGTEDQFICFVLDPGLTEDVWVDANHITAGNESIVHHVLVYADTDNALDPELVEAGSYDCFGGSGVPGAELVGAWAPGGLPFYAPPDTARRYPAGVRLVMQVHYHPTGAGDEVDQGTSFDLRFFDSEPHYEVGVQLIGNFGGPRSFGGLLPGPNDRPGKIEFRVPAGAKGHTETMTYTVPEDSPPWHIIGMATHMHYVGRGMEIHIKRKEPLASEPGQECLIDTPVWDFNWQRGYYYDTDLENVPVARPGDQFLMRCNFDNSMDNPFVVQALEEQGLDAPTEVLLGEETLDEMCLGDFIFATERDPEP